jgi:hypothetical protein
MGTCMHIPAPSIYRTSSAPAEDGRCLPLQHTAQLAHKMQGPLRAQKDRHACEPSSPSQESAKKVVDTAPAIAVGTAGLFFAHAELCVSASYNLRPRFSFVLTPPVGDSTDHTLMKGVFDFSLPRQSEVREKSRFQAPLVGRVPRRPQEHGRRSPSLQVAKSPSLTLACIRQR